MNLHRVRPIVLIACAAMAVSISMATMAQAATTSATAASATTVPQQPDAEGCTYDTAVLGYTYYEADKDRSLDWWARNSASSGTPVILEPVSGSSDLDCFHVEGGFGGGRLAYQLANSDLCLNIAGNSHSVGAWVILYACTYSSNELFYVSAAGTGDGAISIQSSSSGLCIDLSNGYNRGSILEQKNCKYADIYQAWFSAG